MSQAPLPPHERTWRHPSELAAAEREAFRTGTTPSATRLFAMVTGSLGLIAVGMLVLTFGPDRDRPPVALSATTIPSAVPARLSGIAAIGRLASDADAVNDVAAVVVEPALATPIGDGRSAYMTIGSRPHHNGVFDVRLTSGSVVSAAVLDTTADGLVLVTIAVSEQAHTVANEPPDPDEIVTVLAHPPVTVPFADIGLLDLAEGTPVLDHEGALVGLCTRSRGGATVLDVTRHGVEAPKDPVGDETDATTDPTTDPNQSDDTTDPEGTEPKPGPDTPGGSTVSDAVATTAGR